MYKRFLILLFVVLLFSSLFRYPIVHSSNEAPEMMINGGFETGDFTDWTGMVGRREIISDAGAQSGDCYAKVFGRTNKLENIKQSVTIQSNRSYVYSAWLKVDQPQPGVTMGLAGYYTDSNGAVQYVNIGYFLALNTGWTKIGGTKSIDLGSLQTASLTIYLESSGGFYETLYMDGYSVKQRYYAETVDVSGKASITLKSGQEITEGYTAVVKNQEGTATEMPAEVTWSVVDKMTQTPKDNITIDGNGLLSISEESEECTLLIYAQANDLNTVIWGSKEVTLIKPLSESEIMSLLEKAKQDLLEEDLTVEPSDAVTTDLRLPSDLEKGVVVEWESSNESVISVSGRVTPSVSETHYIILTAKFIYEDYMVKKNFYFVVPVNKNIIRNSGFEQDLGSEWAKINCVAQQDLSERHGGFYSARISGRAAAWHSIRQTITVKNNIPYLYSVWIKLPEGAASNKFKFVSEPSFDDLSATAKIANANEWTHLSVPYTVSGPTGGSTTFVLFVMDTAPIADSFYMDDWSVEPVVMKWADITGPTFVRVPSEGKRNIKQFSVIKKNQLDDVIVEGITDWYVVNPDTMNPLDEGISMGSTGKLTITSAFSPGIVLIKAVTVLDDISIISYKEVVIEKYLDEDAAVSKALDEITFSSLSSENIGNVTTDLNLPQKKEVQHDPAYTVFYAWLSDMPSVISNDGKVIPSEMGDFNVSLTVTVTVGEVSEKKVFVITVPKLVNFFVDGGFEEQSLLNWQVSPDGRGEISSSAKKSGNYGLKLLNFDGSKTDVKQEINMLKEDRAYHLSIWCKSPSGRGEISLYVEKGGKRTILHTMKINNTDWNKPDSLFVFNSEGLFPYYIGFSVSQGEFYIDDFSIEDLTEKLTLAAKAVSKAESTASKEDVDIARAAVQKLPESNRKTAMLQRLEEIQTGKKQNAADTAKTGGTTSVTRVDNAASDVVQKPVDAKPPIFEDIDSHWAMKEILFLKQLGIVKGVYENAFMPELHISRAEFAAFLIRLLDKEPYAYAGDFTDVSNSDWYSDTVQAISALGLMNGYNGYFRPNDKISREEMVKVIVTAYEYKAGPIELSESKVFDDGDEISDWAVNTVMKALSANLIKGISDRMFSPQALCTRAQAATVIKRLYDKLSN